MSAVINPASPRFNSAAARASRRPSLVSLPAVGRARSPQLFIVSTLIIGFLGIALANLLMTVATSTGVYQVANLKATKQKLALDTQILGQQVTSLSSNQNLSNAAAVLGMVSNSTPVFLNVNEQKVYGTPAAAVATKYTRFGKNLVPNAAMVTKTQPSALKAAVAMQNELATAPIKEIPAPITVAETMVPSKSSATANAAGASRAATLKSVSSPVALSGGIPAAPSH
jgi:phage baseplate assembly protein gpV